MEQYGSGRLTYRLCKKLSLRSLRSLLSFEDEQLEVSVVYGKGLRMEGDQATRPGGGWLCESGQRSGKKRTDARLIKQRG